MGVLSEPPRVAVHAQLLFKISLLCELMDEYLDAFHQLVSCKLRPLQGLPSPLHLSLTRSPESSMGGLFSGPSPKSPLQALYPVIWGESLAPCERQVLTSAEWRR